VGLAPAAMPLTDTCCAVAVFDEGAAAPRLAFVTVSEKVVAVLFAIDPTSLNVPAPLNRRYTFRLVTVASPTGTPVRPTT
jgi:hypothetical protein